MEKAKYIRDKERTLYNDLNSAQKKLKEIANWYPLSDYDINLMDEKNFKLFIQKVNNIYFELQSLLFNTRTLQLYREDIQELITDRRLSDLAEVEEKIMEIKRDRT